MKRFALIALLALLPFTVAQANDLATVRWIYSHSSLNTAWVTGSILNVRAHVPFIEGFEVVPEIMLGRESLVCDYSRPRTAKDEWRYAVFMECYLDARWPAGASSRICLVVREAFRRWPPSPKRTIKDQYCMVVRG